MLTIEIPDVELFDDEKQKFLTSKGATLVLEHSLVSLSKWEQTWGKPFLGNETRTTKEAVDYIRCMTLSPENLPEVFYTALPGWAINQINDYINNKMTATWFSDVPGQTKSRSGEVITSEIIYYWLIALDIPFEVQHWHLNRLLTLIRVVNIKNDPKKKMMPKKDAAEQRRLLNEQRKQRLNTRG